MKGKLYVWSFLKEKQKNATYVKTVWSWCLPAFLQKAETSISPRNTLLLIID